MVKKRSVVGIDWILLSVFLSIVFIGWLMLYASSYEGPGFWFDLSSPIGRQTIWLGVSAVFFVVMYNIDWRIWNSLSVPIYFLALLSLVAVLLFGNEIKGAKSWFLFMGFSIQPSEFVKIATALAVSSYLSRASTDMAELRKVVFSMLLFLAPAFLIFLQPDAGTAIIYLAFLVPLFREGLNASFYVLGLSMAFIFIGSLVWTPYVMLIIIFLMTYLFLALNSSRDKRLLGFLFVLSLFAFSTYNYIGYGYLLLIVVLAGLVYYYDMYLKGSYREIILALTMIVGAASLSFGTQWSFDKLLKPHQQTRINVWLKPELCDPKLELYNLIQSKTAIGSGGFSGKGFLNGTMTKLNYVPEQNTDFVFSILGEEQGFIGSLSLIVLFTVLILRICQIAERSSFAYIRIFCYSVAGIFFFHFFINVGMTMGITPVIGIPLPFISKGGSSLLAFTIMIAMVLKMDLARSRY